MQAAGSNEVVIVGCGSPSAWCAAPEPPSHQSSSQQYRCANARPNSTLKMQGSVLLPLLTSRCLQISFDRTLSSRVFLFDGHWTNQMHCRELSWRGKVVASRRMTDSAGYEWSGSFLTARSSGILVHERHDSPGATGTFQKHPPALPSTTLRIYQWLLKLQLMGALRPGGD